jgi:3-dehydroquinate dehydratase/shikimate dehydrogenase
MLCLSFKIEDSRSALPLAAQYSAEIDYLEVRMDSGDIEMLRELKQKCDIPLILTCRAASHGGSFVGSESERLSLISQLAELKPDFLDVEFGTEAAALIDSLSDQKFILSSHPVSSEVSEWREILSEMLLSKAAKIKFVPMANKWADNLALLKLIKEFHEPRLNAFCQGSKSLFSRIAARSISSNPLTYCSLSASSSTAPGQISISDAIELYRLKKLSRNPSFFGIVGKPISHSLSPAFHNSLFRSENIDAVYLPFEVEKFDEFIEFALSANIKGLSVTSPWKYEAYNFACNDDLLSERTRTSNTLILSKDGYIAFNTDGPGLLAALEIELGHVQGKKILLIGAGGAGTPILASLLEAGALVTAFSRNHAKGVHLAAQFGCISINKLDSLTKYDVVINATPLVAATDQESELMKIASQLGSLAVDLHYSPEETYFLREAKQSFIKTMNGEQMFIQQAMLQALLWKETLTDGNTATATE